MCKLPTFSRAISGCKALHSEYHVPEEQLFPWTKWWINIFITAKLIYALKLCLLYIFNTLLERSRQDFSIPQCHNTTCNKCQVFLKEESLLETCTHCLALFCFLKIGHGANVLSAAGGNVKKCSFKRVSSSSSQCNDTAAKSGFNYKSGGMREGGS